MQCVTSALISAKRETMRARLWSVGLVAPSPRDNLYLSLLCVCIVPDTKHVPINLFFICLFLIPRSRRHNGSVVQASCLCEYISVYILTSVIWKATPVWFSLVGVWGRRRARETYFQSIYIMGNHKEKTSQHNVKKRK